MKKAATLKIIISSVCILILTAWLVLGIIFGNIGIVSWDTNNFNFHFSGVGMYITYNESGYSIGNFDSEDVPSSLDIDWICGNVSFEKSEDGKLHVSESNDLSDDFRMRVKLENGTLMVKPVKSGLNAVSYEPKDLKIQLPDGCELNTLALDNGAGDVRLNNITTKNFDTDMGAGNVSITSSSIKSFDLDMGAGNLELDGDFGKVEVDMGAGKIELNGTMTSFDGDAGAGAFRFNLKNSPDKIDIDTAGGDIHIVLPSDCPGFDAEIDAALGAIEVNGFSGSTKRIHSARYGNGHTEINADLAAGTLYIEEAD